MQKKLAKLGLYDGPLDGIEGPKMRRAIALWKQQINSEMQNNILPHSTTDEIAILIKQSEMEIADETKKVGDVSHSKETILARPVIDIKQVQKALRIFGHPEIVINGIEDQKTIEALKQFQKIFDLPITGKVDHTVVMKMREVGLLD
ncbi:peptidoglycan hydrolase-like protein with peptidoglycan-binding domain [Bartonella japonica]|uniref:Peptidoglycan hydrolase-like protein with peptidoglycan-binding domain n=2 Tax=Bartonella japonica TaxID=357761 RepID=A0ABV2FMF8_9HYPH